MAYSWITLAQARSALLARLANQRFWTATECNMAIAEALRTWNALTEWYIAEFLVPFLPNTTWYDLSTAVGSPRQRILTDDDLYRQMQAHLLEPLTGVGAWTGTNQFTLSDLSEPLQRRRDEVIQVCSCNLATISLPSTPNIIRTALPDNVIEPRRMRFIPTPLFGNPNTLTREDTEAFDYFEAPDQPSGTPASWSVVTEPPLAVDVDVAPVLPGSYEMIVLESGTPSIPPAISPLDVPDDWSWLVKFGALADVLGRESEATDRARSAYCMQRYQDGIKILKAANFIQQASIMGESADLTAVLEHDSYMPEWEQNPNDWNNLVIAGMDYVAPSPVGSLGVIVSVIGNAPVPVNDGDFIQIPRDVWEVILGYAQHLLLFKCGGAEFESTQPMLENFFNLAQQNNKRLAKLGLFTGILRTEGKVQDEVDPRE